ncbi:TauD/TfdA dioxygenase family protein [Mycobacteroides chelonae]|uniref:TauD/TfdA dioxygenase family protein n=1 Tax=Mycobacteroides chelonae TaxID=1774 RepID=UPI000A7050DD|nr:TauD/TfdA family dioxygenase [Mycobacteroides chelonae]
MNQNDMGQMAQPDSFSGAFSRSGLRIGPVVALRAGPLVAERAMPGTELPGAYTQFSIKPISPTIGAEVSGVRISGAIEPAVLEELRRALLEWKVLFFHDQDITRQEHKGFAARWGSLEPQNPYKAAFNGQEDGDLANFMGGSENIWHNDVTWLKAPTFAAVLRAVEIPDVGGDTLWSDTGAAYDLLPEELQLRVNSLVAEHDWAHNSGLSEAQIATLRPYCPPAEHPVVRLIPETGRRVLFVNRIFTKRIVGLSDTQSAELLDALYQHMNRAEFQVRLRWRKNTIAMWDNRTCQHYAASDYSPKKRVMERVSIAGNEPIGINK